MTLACVLLALTALTGLVATGPGGFARAERWLGSSALDTTREHSAWRAFWLADAVVQQPTTSRLLLLGAVAVLFVLHRWRLGIWATTVLVLSLVLAGVAKEALRRDRPSWVDPVATVGGYSYPSGHATAAWTAATAAVLLGLAMTRRRSARRCITGIAVVGALVVSLDRVFLGVHYPSDVIAGALLGILVALVPWLLVVRPTLQAAGHETTR